MDDCATNGPATRPAESPFIRRCRAGDIDEHTRQLKDWDLVYDQLDRGRFEGGFVDIRLPGLQLFRERTTRGMRQRGTLIPGSFGIAVPLAGDGGLIFNGTRVSVGALVSSGGDEIDLLTPPDCTLVGLVVDADALHAASARRPADAERLVGEGIRVAASSDALARWRDRLCATIDAIVDHPGLVADEAGRARLQADLLGALLDAVSDTPCEDAGLGIARRKRLVDRACELLLAEKEDPPSLQQLCRRLGTSPRKLGYCFQDVIGMSPARFVKTMRLNAVRRELSRATDPALGVYDIAVRWGFWHFSHFTSDYKRQFDELPSETLRRARA